MTKLNVITNASEAFTTLQITEAPMPGAVRYSNGAEDGLDGWGAFGGTTVTVSTAAVIAGTKSWRVAFPGDHPATSGMSRNVTGLTVGNTYRLTAYIMVAGDAPAMKITVGGSEYSSATTLRDVPQKRTFTFIATATTMPMRIVSNTVSPTTATEVFVDTISVAPIATGDTTITRSDINGTNIPVRLAVGQGIVGGSLTVEDHEAALAGPIEYVVTDGAGAVVTKTVFLDKATVPHLTVALRPSFRHKVSGAVTNYQEGREANHTIHEIIGRSDVVAVLGRLKQRRGTIVFRELSRLVAERINSVYFAAETVLIRYPYDPLIGITAVGDMYHLGMNVTMIPEGEVNEAGEQHWTVTVEYIEVIRPEGNSF